MKEHRLPECRCGECGSKLDAATSLFSDALPSPGDLTICLTCGHLYAYAEDRTLRALTDAEQIEIAGDKRLLIAQRARGEYWRTRR